MEYKRFVRISAAIVFYLLIVLFIILLGVYEIKEENILNFTFSVCDNKINPNNESELGIREIRWLNNKTLFVKAYARFNCVEEIIAGGVEVEDKRIKLVYKSPLCWPNTACADCYCVRTLIFTYEGIDEGNYDFELKRIS